MIPTVCDIVNSIVNFFANMSNMIGLDALFFIALAVEVAIVVFFLVKSMFSYEARLNRALEKLNYWLFEKKVVNEDNIKELNMLFKMSGSKRLCYYWQQYILFREGTPSSYLSSDNLIDKPLKTSSFNSNIKNLTIFSSLWAGIVAMFVLIASCFDSYLTGKATVIAIFVPVLVALIGVIFIVFLRSRKNVILNSLFQNVQLFGRFMDNACVDLPSYIDYQILFTPQEIENGQPVLREFLDYKARKEKEEFNRAKEDDYKHESYDFSTTGVDGSIVLDRAMKESELYLKKKEKILLNISQLESELDSRRKNFDNVQKDYQTKLQASKENVDRLRQMQEETTNRIESNYYRKQQTQEIGKQEQLEQEFEQQRAKYLLEKNEGEEEITKLNAALASYKVDVQNAMISEYQTFFDKFCQSAEKVVAKSFSTKLNNLKEENDKNKQYITELEIKLKNIPQGQFDAQTMQNLPQDGQYDDQGNYVYANGTFYDKDGNFHDEKGNVYSQDGTLISEAQEVKAEKTSSKEKEVVNFDSFDAFDFMTDTTQKGDIYDIAEKIVNDVDVEDELKVVNNTQKSDFATTQEQQKEVAAPPKQEVPQETIQDETEEKLTEVAPNLTEKTSESVKRRGRPKKEETVEKPKAPPKKAGRPKKITTATPVTAAEKRGRGRPKKITFQEINKKLSDEEKKINEMSSSINRDLQSAMNGMESESAKNARRNELIKEIDKLQNEAQQVIARNEPESKIEEINRRLEMLLDEIQKLG